MTILFDLTFLDELDTPERRFEITNWLASRGISAYKSYAEHKDAAGARRALQFKCSASEIGKLRQVLESVEMWERAGAVTVYAYLLLELGAVPAEMINPTVPVPPAEPEPPAPPTRTLPLFRDQPQTWQNCINVFDRAFGRGQSGHNDTLGNPAPWYIWKLIELNLLAEADIKRSLAYDGPAIEEMTGLSGGDDDRKKLFDAVK
jgi:hypothetical protein